MKHSRFLSYTSKKGIKSWQANSGVFCKHTVEASFKAGPSQDETPEL